MASVFRGRFETKLDPKGRLSLPSSIRQSLTQGLSSTNPTSLVITNSQYKGLRCLDVYSLVAWEALEKKIASLPALKTEVQAFQRLYLSSGQVVEPDSQGRILVPQSLRSYAKLDSEVELVGMGEKFEIWSSDSWNQLFNGLSQNFEDVLSAVSQLEIA